MYIKRYTIASIILMILVGWYVFSYVTQDTMSIDFFGTELPSFSTALWVIVPLVVFYVASVFHMSFYSMLNNFKLRKYEKDYEKLIGAIAEAYLGKENRNYAYKTPRYKLLGFLVDNSVLFPTSKLNADIDNDKISSVIKLIEDVKSGNVVDLRKYSLEPTNELVIQNDKNRYKKGNLKAEEILSNPNKYNDSLSKEVFVDFVKTASLKMIEKYKSFLTKDSLFEILKRVNTTDNPIEISNETLISLFDMLDLNKKDYIEISSALALDMIPDQRIKLFETLSESKEEAMDAYLFTLFDLEMLAPADEILENTQDSEYINFKAYRALKRCNKHYDIKLFV